MTGGDKCGLGIFLIIAVLCGTGIVCNHLDKRVAMERGYSQILQIAPGGSPRVLWVKLPQQNTSSLDLLR